MPVVECENCLKEYETEYDSILYDVQMCKECYEAYPVNKEILNLE